MKKVVCVFLILFAFLTTSLGVNAQELMLSYDGALHKYTGNIYKLKVNNELVESDIPPVILDNRSLVPVRAIFEKLGAAVSWEAKTKKVSVSYNGISVELKINDYYALINGSKVKMEVPAKIINDRTMVPLRFVGEQLNMEVGWHPEKNEITIDNKITQEHSSIKDIKYIKGQSGQQISIDLDQYQNYRIMRLPSPDRIVVDFPNTKVLSATQNIDVNDELVKTVRCGQFDDNIARVVLDVVGQPQYQVSESNTQLKLNIKQKVLSSSDEDTETPEKPDSENQLPSGESDIPVDNQLNVKYIARADYEEVIVRVKDYAGYQSFTLPDPHRIVVDIPNAIAPDQQKTIDINSSLIKSVRYAKKEENGARLVVDLKDSLQYKMIEENGQLVVLIARTPDAGGLRDTTPSTNRSEVDRETVPEGNHLSVSYKVKEQHEEVIMALTDYSSYNIVKQVDLNRIIIDLPNSTASSAEQKIEVKSSQIESIRYAGVGSSLSRVIIQLSAQSQYVVIEAEGRLVLNIIPSVAEDSSQTEEPVSDGQTGSAPNTSNGEEPKEEPKEEPTEKPVENPKGEPKEEPTEKPVEDLKEEPKEEPTEKPVEDPKEEPQEKPEDGLNEELPEDNEQNGDKGTTDGNSEDNASPENDIRVEYSSNENIDKVTIWAKDYGDCNVWRLTGPDRIVVDILNANAGKDQKTIKVDSNLIDSVRYAQYEKSSARVVIDVSGQPQYQVVKMDGKIVIYVVKPTYKNITYNNNGDRVHFILQGARLTEGGENLKKFYKERYDLEGKRYTVTFPSELADLGNGIININDAIISNVAIFENPQTKETSIVFSTKESYNYEIITRYDVDNTTITIFKKATKKDRLVVIDAGHGGKEPGATYGGIYEKDLNLDIAKRLNALLKSKNVKTYMTREDDSYVGLYERAYIANSLNATLFISIHNNAFHSRFKGTETLHYPQSEGDPNFNGEKFAKIIQTQLVNMLGTVNRGTIERPNLVVLKATKMHAALAEIAFMTNKEDMARLKSEEFRQKSAEALCEAILKALEEVE